MKKLNLIINLFYAAEFDLLTSLNKVSNRNISTYIAMHAMTECKIETGYINRLKEIVI